MYNLSPLRTCSVYSFLPRFEWKFELIAAIFPFATLPSLHHSSTLPIKFHKSSSNCEPVGRKHLLPSEIFPLHSSLHLESSKPWKTTTQVENMAPEERAKKRPSMVFLLHLRISCLLAHFKSPTDSRLPRDSVMPPTRVTATCRRTAHPHTFQRQEYPAIDSGAVEC